MASTTSIVPATVEVQRTGIVYLRYPISEDGKPPVPTLRRLSELLLSEPNSELLLLIGEGGSGGGDCFALVDGGTPAYFFGGVTPLDGGTVT